MRIALADLRLDRLTVLYPGDRTYSLGERVAVVPLAALAAGEPEAILSAHGEPPLPGVKIASP